MLAALLAFGLFAWTVAALFSIGEWLREIRSALRRSPHN